MTLCVGVQREGSVDIYTDSLVTCNGPFEFHEKAFRAHGLFWATAGDAPMDQYLKALKVTPFSGNVKLPFDVWFTRNIAAAWIEVKNHMHADMDCTALVVARGQLYELSGGMYLSKPSRPYCAIGSGAPYAYGAMEAGAEMERVFEIVAGLIETVGGKMYSYEGVR